MMRDVDDEGCGGEAGAGEAGAVFAWDGRRSGGVLRPSHCHCPVPVGGCESHPMPHLCLVTRACMEQAEKTRHQATTRKCAGVTTELSVVQEEMRSLRAEAQKAAKMCESVKQAPPPPPVLMHALSVGISPSRSSLINTDTQLSGSLCVFFSFSGVAFPDCGVSVVLTVLQAVGCCSRADYRGGTRGVACTRAGRCTGPSGYLDC
jgi:hypothetical protein